MSGPEQAMSMQHEWLHLENMKPGTNKFFYEKIEGISKNPVTRVTSDNMGSVQVQWPAICQHPFAPCNVLDSYR